MMLNGILYQIYAQNNRSKATFLGPQKYVLLKKRALFKLHVVEYIVNS